MKRPSLPRRPRIIAFAARWTSGAKFAISAAAEAAAAEIASLAPLVQRAAKAMMRGRRGKDGRFMADARYQECFDSRDYQEGLRAFAEGRDPVFNGS